MRFRINLLAAVCVCLCLLTALVPTVTFADPAPTSGVEVGEVDGDGNITSTDARLALQLAVEKIKESDLKIPAATDVDMDGKVTSTDARLILQYAVGKITQFPAGGPSIIPKDINPPSLPDTEAQTAAIRRSANAIVFKCADAAVKAKTGDPTVEIQDRTILEEDDYLRYVIKVIFKASDKSETVYLLLKVNSSVDGQFSWTHDGTGWTTPISEEDKDGFGWGDQPEDWNLDSAPDLSKAVTVSLQSIYDDPAKYRNKLVRIQEKLVIGSNNLHRNSYYTCIATGDGVFDYNADRIFEVVYDIAPNLDECRKLEATFDPSRGYKKISVCGYVRIYSNIPDPYIQVVEILLP